MLELFQQAAWWGALGAFIPAQSELFVCMRAAQETHHSRIECFFKFVCALIVGSIGAAAFGPFFADFFKLTTPRGINTVTTAVGMIANVLWPVFVRFGPKFAELGLTIMKGKPE